MKRLRLLPATRGTGPRKHRAGVDAGKRLDGASVKAGAGAPISLVGRFAVISGLCVRKGKPVPRTYICMCWWKAHSCLSEASLRPISPNLRCRRPGERRGPATSKAKRHWIPAFAGMTKHYAAPNVICHPQLRGCRRRSPYPDRPPTCHHRAICSPPPSCPHLRPPHPA